MRYRISRQADAQLDEITGYIARDNPDAAARVLDALFDAFQLLARDPEIGTLRDDLRPGLRVFTPKAPARNYVICYYARSAGIEIGHVFNARPNWMSILQGD